jgi:tetratricopeptide (TPR) repeat protein
MLGPLLIFSVAMGVSVVAGKGAGTLYMPSGSSTPRKKEYSRAQSLVARGEYEDAIRAFEVEILDFPLEPEPYLRIARLCRDQLKDHDQALAWFRRATREAELSGGQEIRTRREIAEIFLHHRKEPRKAAPELARLVEAYPNTPDGEWAAMELAQIKEEMAKEE